MSENKSLMTLPEVVVNFTPAVISVNIDELKTTLIAQVTEQSNTVVTVDNLQESKKLMADMNKTKGAISSARIKYAKEAGINITSFEASMKELESICADGVAKIKEQTTRFEDEARAKALEVLKAYLVEQGTAKGIKPQFQCATVDDLVSLGTLTGTGKLSAKSKSEVDARVAADLAMQQQTEMRLLKLELESHNAGLAAPLTQNHVELFLYEPENVYQMRLAHLFEAELKREAMAREAAERRAADEARRNAEAQQRAIEAEARAKQEAEKNRIIQEQMEYERQQQAEQMRLQQEQYQRDLAAAKAQPVQQQIAPEAVHAVQQPATQSNEFAIAPVMQAKTNSTRFTGDDSGALFQALQVASSSGHAEIWRKGQPPQLVAVVITGQAAIDYRNAVKAQ